MSTKNSVFAQTTLPNRKPKNDEIYTRKNGRRLLSPERGKTMSTKNGDTVRNAQRATRNGFREPPRRTKKQLDDRNACRYSPRDWEFRASKERLFADDGNGYALTETEFGRMFLDELIMSSVPQPSARHTEIIHLDGDTLNNRLPNLRWGTRAEFIAWNED